jgi:folate-binding protein YgfZ
VKPLQTRTSSTIDQSQINALASECGLIRWEKATIVRHTGPDALDLLHRLTTKDLLSLGVGESRRAALTSDRGRVVDVFLVAHVAEDELLLISDSAESDRTVTAIDYYTIIENAELVNLSNSHSRVSLIGPTAQSIAESVFGAGISDDLARTSNFADTVVTLAGDSSRGIGWLDVICENDAEAAVVEALEQGGAIPIDYANFEYFRIDNAIPGSDQEYGEHANPIEAGLLPLIDFDKGCYVGQEVIARLDAYDKVQRNVRVLRSSSPLADQSKLTVGSKPAGVVTSVSSIANVDGEYLSLALVRKAFIEQGTELNAGDVPATVR